MRLPIATAALVAGSICGLAFGFVESNPLRTSFLVWVFRDDLGGGQGAAVLTGLGAIAGLAVTYLLARLRRENSN